MTAVEKEILEIMAEYDRQEAGLGVDTPGGFEHMGDVWKMLSHWRRLIQATESVTPRYANPRLIAAAPELLAAVRAWQRFAEECARVDVPMWALLLNDKAIELTIAAIAKVEGISVEGAR